MDKTFTEVSIPSCRYEELIAKEERLSIIEGIIASKKDKSYGDYTTLKMILGIEVPDNE